MLKQPAWVVEHRYQQFAYHCRKCVYHPHIEGILNVFKDRIKIESL